MRVRDMTGRPVDDDAPSPRTPGEAKQETDPNAGKGDEQEQPRTDRVAHAGEPHQVSEPWDQETWYRRLQMAEGLVEELKAETGRLAIKNVALVKDRDTWRDNFAELMTSVEVFLSAHTSERKDRNLQALREAVVKGGTRWRT